MSITMKLASCAAVLCTIAISAKAATNPTITLNNGVKMPQMALGTWQYNDSIAADAIAKGWKGGFTHFDTAESYKNQVGVGQGINAIIASGVKRSDIFLTTKTLPCTEHTTELCYQQTKKDIAGDFADLKLDYVDLILLHGASHRGQGPCDQGACDADRGQWKAYEELYKAGKAKAIGVSNYCQSCFECLIGNATVQPAVNQIQFHVGMGDDPEKLISYTASKNIVVQAYSPLGNGKLIMDKKLAAIGKTYKKSAAQVAMKWLVDKGVAVVTKADNSAYIAEDIDMYSWNMTAADTKTLSADTSYPDVPSWACTE